MRPKLTKFETFLISQLGAQEEVMPSQENVTMGQNTTTMLLALIAFSASLWALQSVPLENRCP
jgi:hypothetical protein